MNLSARKKSYRVTVKLSVIRSRLIVIVLGLREAGDRVTDPSIGRRGRGIRRDGVRLGHDHALNFHLVGHEILHGYRVVAAVGICNPFTRLVVYTHVYALR